MNIKWDSHGDGPALLLIQGLGYGRWGWDPVVPGLAERHRVLSFDNRGIGDSDKPDGPYTARMMADDALQVLDEAGVERAHVVGASLGGMIAQELAVLAPERVEKLVLCCTTSGGPEAFPLPEATLKLMAEAPTLAPAVALAASSRTRSGASPSESLVDEIFALRVANPPDPAGWQAQAAAGTTFLGVDGAMKRRPSSCTARRTMWSTFATPSCLQGAFPAHAWVGPRHRPPLLLGKARGVPRSRHGVPRVSAFTLDRWIRDRARNTPARVAVDFAGAETTYAQLDRRSDELAASLSHGDVVSTLTGNSVEQIALFFGCAKAGAILHPISWRLAPAEVAYQIEDAGSSFLLATDEHRALAEAALALAAAAPATELATRAGPAHVPADEDGLLLIYTSGTTGKPKGALLTHANCFWTNLSFDLATGIGGDDVALAFLPQFHVGGWNVQPLLSWWKGARIVLEPAFDPKRALELIGEKRITTLMGVPANYLFMAREPSFASADLSSLRRAVVGGASMPVPLIEAWRERGVEIVQGYGLTEASPNVLCLPPEDAMRKIGSAGKPYPFVDVEVGAQGELLVRGPNVFPGYWRNPEATATTLGEDGCIPATSSSEMRRDTSGSRAGSRRCSSPAARTSTPRRSRRCSTSMPLCTTLLWSACQMRCGVRSASRSSSPAEHSMRTASCTSAGSGSPASKCRSASCSSMSCRATRWGRSRRTSCCRR